MAGLLKGKGFSTQGVLKLVLMTAVLLFFIGKVIIPFISPILGKDGIPAWTVLENINVVMWFGVVFTTIILLFIMKVFMKETFSTKTIGIAILLGVGIWYLATSFPELFSWLNASLASAQALILP